MRDTRIVDPREQMLFVEILAFLDEAAERAIGDLERAGGAKGLARAGEGAPATGPNPLLVRLAVGEISRFRRFRRFSRVRE